MGEHIDIRWIDGDEQRDDSPSSHLSRAGNQHADSSRDFKETTDIDQGQGPGEHRGDDAQKWIWFNEVKHAHVHKREGKEPPEEFFCKRGVHGVS